MNIDLGNEHIAVVKASWHVVIVETDDKELVLWAAGRHYMSRMDMDALAAIVLEDHAASGGPQADKLKRLFDTFKRIDLGIQAIWLVYQPHLKAE